MLILDTQKPLPSNHFSQIIIRQPGLIILEFHNHVFTVIIHFLYVQTHHTITVALQCGSNQHRHLPVMLHYTQNNKCEGKAICQDGIWCSRGIAPLIPQFGINGSQRSASSPVCCTHSQERTLKWPLNRRLGGPYTWCGHFLENKDLLPLPGRNQTLDCPACMVVNLLTTISWT